jgi:2-iminobutanoate/2-iminopropanoate deaminase
MRKVIYTEKAPKPIASYTQGLVINDEIVTSGQIGIDLNTGKLAEGIEEQTKLSLKYNIAIIEACRGSINNVFEVLIFLTDMSLYGRVNEIYEQTLKPYFPDGDYPTRAVAGAASLPKNALIEIKMRAKVK